MEHKPPEWGHTLDSLKVSSLKLAFYSISTSEALLTFDRHALQKVVAHQLGDFIDPEQVLPELLEPTGAHEAAIAEGCLRLAETINNSDPKSGFTEVVWGLGPLVSIYFA